MAIGWFTVLKNVPWTTVISNAPVVADGARKLWKTVANKRASHESDAEAASATDQQATPPAANQAPLDARLGELSQSVDRLEQQMLASSELINALAEQNAQLVERVESNRVRTLWLTRLAAFAAVLAGLALGLVLFALTRA